MLNKKSAFKPKAAIRRPAPGSASQGPQPPSTAEQLSKTPAPAEPSPSSESQPARRPVNISQPVTSNGPSGDIDAISEVQVPVERVVVEPTPQASTSSIIPTAIVTEGRGKSLAPLAATATRADTELPASAHLERPVTPTVPGPVAAETPVTSTEAGAQSGLEGQPAGVLATVATPTLPEINTLIDNTVSPAELIPSTQTPSAAAPQAPSATASGEQLNFPDGQSAQAAAMPTENAANEQPQPTTESTFEPIPSPAEATKPRRGRKRTTKETTAGDSAEQSTAAPPRKRLRKRAAPLPGEEGYQGKQATTRRTRAQKRSGPTTASGDTQEDGEGNAARPKRRPPKARREATPEDAENVEVDVTQVKMADLAKDMHIGKKFSLHDELMERERAKRLRYSKRKRQQNGDSGDDVEGNGADPGATPASDQNNSAQKEAAEDASTDAAGSSTRRSAPIGEQYQIIDGEIVLDHRSLQVDRHARAREEAGDLVEVVENDFSHHTTSATYLRRNLKPQQWTDEETDLFYRALQAFGTDFDTICRMFRGKTRKHVKLKFNREERVAPDRVTAALVGQKTVGMSLEQYQRATGREYEPAEAIYAEQRRAEEDFERRQKALEEEKLAEVRRKREELLAQLGTSAEGGGGGGGDGNGNAAGEGGQAGNGKAARRGRKKKAAQAVGL